MHFVKWKICSELHAVLSYEKAFKNPKHLKINFSLITFIFYNMYL